uniref:Uncharacterized protein n=1 Tax=Rhizophora mucronata TaxID=61149 RepID=A0A2P2IS80_RHIMU
MTLVAEFDKLNESYRESLNGGI